MPTFRRTVTRRRFARQWYAPSRVAGGGTLAVGTATFTLTGQSVGLRALRSLPVGAAVFTLSAQPVGLRRVITEPIAPATFAVTGQAVALRASRRLAVANASYALSAQPVGLLFTRRLPLANASFTLTGEPVVLRAARRLSIANATFVLNGQAVTLTKVSAVGVTTMVVSPAVFTLTGRAVSLRTLRRMAVAAAMFTITGSDVRLGVAHLEDPGTQFPSRGIVERRFGAIRTRNRPASVFVDRPTPLPSDSVAGSAWTPADHSGAGLALTLIDEACRVVRATGMIYAFFALVLPVTASPLQAAIGLPIIARDTGVPVAPVAFSYLTVGDVTGIVVNGASQFNLYHTDGSPVTNADLSGAVMRGCAIYEAAS